LTRHRALYGHRDGVAGLTVLDDQHLGGAIIPRNAIYPDLAGQHADYLVLQLRLFRRQHRGGTDHAHLMRPVAQRLTPEQMRDVALYYASLAVTPEGRADEVELVRRMPPD
jgi:cytochrome c553